MTDFLTQKASPKMMSFVATIGFAVFLPLLLVALYQGFRIATKARGVAANIVVDASNVLEPIQTDFYHAFSQGGEEAQDMLGPVFDEVKALKPKTLRLDHIYDHYDVVHKNGGNLSYDWSKLDPAVDTMVKMGATPLLSLSYMPSAIAKDGVVINPPNDWNEWAAVVQATIEHYSGTSGKNLRNVFYEVWNEPDLAQFGSWKMGGEKNYLTLYRYSAIGAANAKNVNRFLLGGPATTGLYKNWIIGLATSGMRVDFFSWHTYLDDPNRYLTDQKNFITWLLPYPNQTIKPSLITEFGFTGAKDKRYGTRYAAAHAAAVIRQLITGGPTYAFAFQPVDGPGQEAGDGWGFMTHPSRGKQKKPRYYVFNFIDRMAGNKLAHKGDGSFVTAFASTKDNVFRVFLVNYDSGSPVVPVRFENLPAATYQVKQYALTDGPVKDAGSSTATVGEDGIFETKVTMPNYSEAIVELIKQ